MAEQEQLKISMSKSHNVKHTRKERRNKQRETKKGRKKKRMTEITMRQGKRGIGRKRERHHKGKF